MIKRTQAYIVVLSNGGSIQIEEEELHKVLEATADGKMILVKKGVINPSYIISIKEDKPRLAEWHKQCNYGGEEGEQNRIYGLKPLKAIFNKSSKIYKQLAESSTMAARKLGMQEVLAIGVKKNK